jgi:hypothetical protein
MEEILKGTTESGFEYKIPKKRLKNFYLMRAASKMEKGDFEAAEKMLNLLFGQEQAEKFLNHLEEGEDFLDSEVLFADIKSIFEANKDLKKS